MTYQETKDWIEKAAEFIATLPVDSQLKKDLEADLFLVEWHFRKEINEHFIKTSGSGQKTKTEC